METPLPSEIIVNKTGRETRVALMENGQLAELHVNRGDRRSYVGNVYKGRVVRVLPGMQAAFVDIGLERAALAQLLEHTAELFERNAALFV